MEYKFVVSDQSYERYASGRVLYSAPGSAPFPVRLIDEVFQRACEVLGKSSHLKLYDPCVGSGYMMTIIGLLHGSQIQIIDGSDIDAKIVHTAEKNLSLLSMPGLQKRIEELKEYEKLYGKQSHTDAIKDAQELSKQVKESDHIKTLCWIHNINTLETSNLYDMIIADLPYENLTSWQGGMDISNTINKWGEALTAGGVMVLISNKKHHFRDYSRAGARKVLQLGKRRITFLKKV